MVPSPFVFVVDKYKLSSGEIWFVVPTVDLKGIVSINAPYLADFVWTTITKNEIVLK